jgi:D-alanyl-D-alanine carboxypeptidase
MRRCPQAETPPQRARVIHFSRMPWWQRFSRDPLIRLHYALGIPADYATRGLPRYPEARVLKPLDGTKHLATPETCIQWVTMRDAAAAAGITLTARWAFRDIASQAQLIRWYLRKGRTMEDVLARVAAPGYSEHHTGRALDVICPECRPPLKTPFEHTPAYQWLLVHAQEFGFVESYKRGNPFGIIAEPWHWCLREDAVSSSSEYDATASRA